MADVFISYASEDRERAQELASSFEARGWTVWWDRKIIVGQSYDQVIEQELEIAKSVVVLWSKDAIFSEWVKNEAAAGAERGVLVPALIDNVKLPLEFRRRQTADLVNWGGDPTHPGYLALCDGIMSQADNFTSALPRRPPPPVPSGFPHGRLWILCTIAVIAGALGIGVYWGLNRATQPTISHPVGTSADKGTIEIADSVAGTYYGDVISDSQGSSQPDVTVTIARVGNRRVRITSDYERLNATEVDLTTTGNLIVGADGAATLSLDMDKNPPRLDYNPGGIAYVGLKQ